MNSNLPAEFHNALERYQRIGLIAGPALVIATAVLGYLLPKAVYPAYLVGFIYWLGVSVACLLLLMVHYLVGGGWGYPIKRMLEAGALAVVPMALLFIPVAIGSSSLYEWTHTEHIDAVLKHKQPFLNLPFWIGRAVVYFVIWSVLAVLYNNWADRMDETSSPRAAWWAQTLAGPGIIAVFLAASFAVIDWCMSLEPHWYSSMYPPLLIIGWGLTTFALAVLALGFLGRYEPMASAVTANRLHDIGNLMLAFVMIWAYMSFMQYLIIWSGNTTEEIPYYLRRTRGGWQLVGIILIVFQFFLPFFVLLFRDVKRGVSSLGVVALIILVTRVVDLTWLIVPAFNDVRSPSFSYFTVLLVPLAVAAVGTFWLGAFFWAYSRRPILPLHDPGIKLELEHAGGH